MVLLAKTKPGRCAYHVAQCMLACSVACFTIVATAQQTLTSQETADIQKDTARHFGDAPDNAGPKAVGLSTSMSVPAISRAMRLVADWQLARAQPYFDRIWTWSVLYSGFMAASASLHDPRYNDAMREMAGRFQWQLRSELPNADDQSVGQTYLELYLQSKDPRMKAPTQTALDALLNSPPQTVPKGQANIPWWWCDALFMAPPVWSRMYASTHDEKYLDYLDGQWWQTSKLLYDPQHHLYFRDATYLKARDAHGNPIFWSRGNGWVMAGIARTLDAMPRHDARRAKYENQLREMAAAVANLQDRQSGLWHANLLDTQDFPLPETSGSALMTYALAWGIRNNLLPRSVYTPVVARAWSGLIRRIYADGRLGCIQQTGAAPAHYLPSSSYTYGVGGFLLAGSEVLALSKSSSGKHTHSAGAAL